MKPFKNLVSISPIPERTMLTETPDINLGLSSRYEGLRITTLFVNILLSLYIELQTIFIVAADDICLMSWGLNSRHLL